MRTRQHGFTLIEVLVVITILTILAAFIVPRIMDRPDQARVVKAQNDIRAIEAALNMYRLDNGNYPSTEQGLNALVQKPDTGNIPRNWRSGYLDRKPVDPWEHEYFYVFPGTHGGEFDLFSYGRDGQPGGESVDADIESWNLK